MGEQLQLPAEWTRGLVRAVPPTARTMATGPARPIIVALRDQGRSWRAVARQLNAARVPTPSGRGQWQGSTVMRHLHADAHAAYMRGWRAGLVRRR